MIKRLGAALVLLLSLTSLARAQMQSQPQYLIKFKQAISAADAERQLGEAGFIMKRLISEIGVYVAAVDGSEKEALKALERAGKVLYVEKDEVRWRINGLATPNDPLYSQQYGLTQISASQAWDLSVGSNQIIVAVSDTGVELTHPDLRNQIWKNAGEVAGNGLDDDGNGLVDDVNGWDYFANDNNPNDENGHGTHCAGIIGAETNNSLGVAGVSWRVTIMPVRFLGPDGSGSTSGGLDTILYATKNGARIVSASWGSGQGSNALKDAIDYAFAHGTIVIAAAGNESSNNDTSPKYPSQYAPISVAASGPASSMASFSNYGRATVSLAAPGLNIMSTYKGGWKNLSGTSMATPMVSGVAALMLSLDSGLTAQELRNGLMNAVVARQAFSQNTRTGGEINALSALRQLSGNFQVWPAKLAVAQGAVFAFSAFKPSGAVTWSVSDSSVARVSSTGELSGLKAGTTTLVGRDSSGVEARADVVVVVAGKPRRGDLE